MKVSYFVAAAIGASLGQASIAATRQDEQLWLDLVATGSLKGRLQGMVQAQPRLRDDGRDVQQLLLRGALGWKASDSVTLWLSYGHNDLPVDHGRDLNEERIFEQANVALGRAAGGEWSARTRLEQRWRSNGDQTGWRLRQQLRFAASLARRRAGPQAIVWNEWMAELRDTDWGARKGIDQVRTFIGIGIAPGRHSTLEIGYLNQVVNRPRGDLAVNHALSIGLTYRY